MFGGPPEFPPPRVHGGYHSLKSDAYINEPCEISLMLLMSTARSALRLALASTGRSIAARIAMMATTISNSISVKPVTRAEFVLRFILFLSACQSLGTIMLAH